MAAVPQKEFVPTKPPFWHDPRIRALIFQVIILVAGFAFFSIFSAILCITSKSVVSALALIFYPLRLVLALFKL